MIVILSFLLCCCKTEYIRTEKVKCNPLSDGTGTYIVNEYNNDDLKIHSVRYTENGNEIEEYEYSYFYDINGRICKIKENDLINDCYKETEYDKFKKKTTETVYSDNGSIIEKRDYLSNGNIRKTYMFKDGKETGYILYDYYSDNQLKNETEYSSDGKTVKMITYYKNKVLYQIKEFGKDGMIDKIRKYSYKGDKLVKESLYDSEFNLTKTTDYEKNPPEIIKYKDGKQINERTAENG